jgi:hypothetical protein
MLAKYSIEYSIRFKRHSPAYHFFTDEPAACVEFLAELLEQNFQIRAIRREGQEMPKADADKMIKRAAAMLASKSICDALSISPEEEHHRFGFAV